MGLDIRIPLWGLFVVLGVLLAAYGLLSSAAMYQRSLGIDINLWWGVVLLAFGLAMLALAWRAAAARARNSAAAAR
jgi:protein-S-isoprenylcysteine O-methyltransferase Ste14